VCDRVLAGRYGYRRPAGGFFLWLNVSNCGGGSDAAVTLWKRSGVKVIPGAFLAQVGRDGTNPGQDYVRLALVHDAATVKEALERFVVVLA
jgi:aspartate/methionine/tyrosine aminotransferase